MRVGCLVLAIIFEGRPLVLPDRGRDVCFLSQTTQQREGRQAHPITYVCCKACFGGRCTPLLSDRLDIFDLRHGLFALALERRGKWLVLESKAQHSNTTCRFCSDALLHVVLTR